MSRHRAPSPAARFRPVGRWRQWLLAVGLALLSTVPAAAAAVATPSPVRPAATAAGLPTLGPWTWPLAGRPPVLRPFDRPDTPYGPGHRGVDLGGSPGDRVLSAGPGVVAFAGVVAGRGVVTVAHPGGLRTTYEPLVSWIRAGSRVRPGSAIGLLAPGHPGCPRPACLHWGLLRGRDYLDPLSLLRRGPVRLLPLHTAAPIAPA